MSTYLNPDARAWRTTAPADPGAVHRALPGYAPTRLVEVPSLADELGVASVHVKEECERFGLPAFKMLGASYAIVRALSARYGSPEEPLPLEVLRERAAGDRPTLVAATDGNHGRAVARTAALLGLPADVLVPEGITQAAKDAIRGEGAHLSELAEPYDDVVRAAAEHAATGSRLLVQDTAWEGYEQIPAWIVEGYSTLFLEADAQLAQAGVEPTLVAVPVGVGSLAGAAVRHHRSRRGMPTVLTVEPECAPAVLSSLQAGSLRSVPTADTVMAGLNCGTPSFGEWPALRAGVDAAVTVSDEETLRAVADLAALGVDSGPCGAASLAGVRALHHEHPLAPEARVLLVSTEGRSANPVPEGQP